MKRLYAEQINKMLEDYYFNLENNPQGRESHYCVLASGIQHIYGAAFCLNDDDTLSELRPLVNDIMNGDIPKPYDLSSIEDEQKKQSSEPLAFIQPMPATVEATPEMLHQLKQELASVPAKLKLPSFFR
ncbi:DUF4754 family protein [Klebsiella pneumoniae]|uniref:DUF4754 family protein n=1 Tax=Klebsiella pneumoniae TaxID=573 RepID=UPI001F2B7071|nr:DUF4754 family protein [Klebsiella pneumoniae]MCE7490490.1 DUF4754 family protein [Klebsiella pneumoniae]MCE7499594.1 DUF4754 family protein [Klebsiella pneumoniae]MCQ8636409.1 DUF4754 family protein [Klebsiella pneumoniae]HBV2138068.1 DUF4754 domain-containing protein [Klebsiella variicola]